MFENGVITNQEKEDALKTDLKVKKDITHAKLAPHFIDATKDELSKDNIDLDETPTLQVFSGLDKELQDCAEDAVTIGLEALEKSYPNLKRKNIPIEGALVAIEPYSGLIKSYVGGRDFSRSQYDRVRLSKRQMGSTFKPFLYLHALEGDKNNPPLTLASELIDEPFTQDIPGGKSWSPENYEGSYNGSVTLRFALEHSLNTPTARLGIQFGADALLNLGKRFFLFDDAPKVLSLSLGVAETSLLQLTAAYGALANNGIYVKPRLFSSAIAELGEIQVGVPITEEKVADENETFLITNILQGVIERGTGKNARSSGFNLPAAGKTGTTNDARDAWFVGFTPSMVAGVWVGFDNNDKIGLTGGLAAAPIWGRFMKCAEPYMDKGDFVKPAWVELRAVEGGEYDEYFVK